MNISAESLQLILDLLSQVKIGPTASNAEQDFAKVIGVVKEVTAALDEAKANISAQAQSEAA